MARKCPKCGGEDVVRTGTASGVGSGGIPPTSPMYRCKTCGKHFRRSDFWGKDQGSSTQSSPKQ